MFRSTFFIRVVFVFILAGVTYRGLEAISPPPLADSSAEMPLGTRIQRLLGWSGLQPQSDRCLRVTVHVFEARSTGVLPLILPPLEAAAVSRYGSRVFDIIRETSAYYDRLIALYPDAQFELLSAEEGLMVLEDNWTGPEAKSKPGGLEFQARDYTIQVRPAPLDDSNWLTMQITVEDSGHFLLGIRETCQADGTPMVIGGPIEGYDQDGRQKALFVGIKATFISQAALEQAKVNNSIFETHSFDRPPRLVALAEVEYPEQASENELDGMSIFLTHIGVNGQVEDAVLALSLRPDYDTAALNAIRKSRFTPASQAYRPVESWMYVPVQFLSSRQMPIVSASKDPIK